MWNSSTHLGTSSLLVKTLLPILVAKGNSTKSIQAFTSALELEPDATDFLVNRAWAFLEAELHEEALADANRCISLEVLQHPRFNNNDLLLIISQPRKHTAYMMRAQYYFNKRMFERAIADLSIALEVVRKYNLLLSKTSFK